MEIDKNYLETKIPIDTSDWTLFGPFDEIALGVLKEKLDLENKEYQVEVSEEEIEFYQKSLEMRPVFNEGPTFTGQKEFFYLKTPFENSLIIKKDLEKLGHEIKPKFLEIDDTQEYICSKCDKVYQTPGSCSIDGNLLLDFSEWTKFQALKPKKIDTLLLIAFFIFFLALLLSLVYEKYLSKISLA